jgi:hypothetical protein
MLPKNFRFYFDKISNTVRHDCTRQFCEIVQHQNNEVDVLKKWKLQRNFLNSSKKTEKEVLDVLPVSVLFEATTGGIYIL